MVTISRLELEVNVLSKMDPSMTHLIDSAPFVAVYTYDINLNQWTKTNQEGVLFIYKKTGKFPYQILVLNRETDDHFFQSITANCKLQVDEPYLMYRVYENPIYALWFHENEVCTKIAARIKGIIADIMLNECVKEVENKADLKSITETPKLNYASISSPSVLNFFLNAGRAAGDITEVEIIKRIIEDPKYNIKSIENQHKLAVKSNY